MRRTARVLSATALAGVALGAAASAAFADPGVEVDPSSVQPGGTVTISVSCDGIGGSPPESIDATSQGFEEGKVQLHRVTGDDEDAAGASYRGTARIPAGGIPEGGIPGGGNTDGGIPDGGNAEGRIPDGGNTDGGIPEGRIPDGGIAEDGIAEDGIAEGAAGGIPGGGPDTASPESQVGVDGRCPVPPGGQEKPWKASYTVARGSGPDRGTAPSPPTVQHGVHAGAGGAFTASLPALIAGSVLIAGALGAAVHRLCHRGSSAGG